MMVLFIIITIIDIKIQIKYLFLFCTKKMKTLSSK